MIELDSHASYRALQTRDPRFDGRLFVGVKTTGIYCRPICPATTPKLENCRFFSSAAAAQSAGFRPCLRCRPDASPDLASWHGTSNTVGRALHLISEGALDGHENSVSLLADRLGVGERQLRRLFLQHLGASPLAVAQTRRLLFAKQLIHDTRLPMAEIALAAGFGSIRRFNDTFFRLYGRPPRDLRRTSKEDRPLTPSEPIVIRLSYRAPYDWSALLSFLAARSIAGIELVEGEIYQRTIEHEHHYGMLQVANLAARNQLLVSIRFPRLRALSAIVRRARRLFDTAADIENITRYLSRDPLLGPLVARRPGLRTPGGWDGFELAVRAILGQQVTVKAASVLAGRMIAAFGQPIDVELTGDFRLSHAFPSPQRLAEADLTVLGMPRSRAVALSALARAAAADPHLFTCGQSLEEAIARFRSLPGVGEWTAQYIALRALREPDAFPASDLGLLQSLTEELGHRAAPNELLQIAERWRPWRAYAAQHLWAHNGAKLRSKTIQQESDHAPNFFHRPGADPHWPHADRL